MTGIMSARLWERPGEARSKRFACDRIRIRPLAGRFSSSNRIRTRALNLVGWVRRGTSHSPREISAQGGSQATEVPDSKPSAERNVAGSTARSQKSRPWVAMRRLG